MKTTPWLACVVCLACAVPALRADQIDDLLSRMRSGAPPLDSTTQNQVVQSALSRTSSAHARAIADAYIAQVKASIVDDANHGGWPCRSWLVYQATPRRTLTSVLKSRFDSNPDAILAYALICPAIYAKDDALMNRALDYLKKFDPFLHQHAQTRMAQFWLPFIRDVQKRQPASSPKDAKAEKDDPFSVLPR